METQPQIDSERLARILDAVPAFDHYAGPDELNAGMARLAEQHSCARVERIGTSRLGEPLRCLTVGDGTRAAVVVGFPHPNEPIGALAALVLAEALCAHERLRADLDFTWHLIPCVDPDGARLNEGWFTGPLTRRHHARSFFRQAPDEQVDWTFPTDRPDQYFDRVLPESLALMRLLDRTRPALMASLHNSESGGAYFYLTKALPALRELLAFIPSHLGLPLDTSNLDAAGASRLAAGIYLARAAEVEAKPGPGHTPPHGSPGWDYARRYGTLTVICEVPHWVNQRAQDERPTDQTYAELLGEQISELTDYGNVIRGTVQACDNGLHDSPLLRAVISLTEAVLSGLPDLRARAAAPEARRPATVAEAFAARSSVSMQRLRQGGMLARVLDAELALGHGTLQIRHAHRGFTSQFGEWLRDAEQLDADSEVIEIRRLVAAQYASVLAAAASV